MELFKGQPLQWASLTHQIRVDLNQQQDLEATLQRKGINLEHKGISIIEILDELSIGELTALKKISKESEQELCKTYEIMDSKKNETISKALANVVNKDYRNNLINLKKTEEELAWNLAWKSTLENPNPRIDSSIVKLLKHAWDKRIVVTNQALAQNNYGDQEGMHA